MKDLHEITEASDVLGWLGSQLEERSAGDPKALEMRLALLLAQSYLAEYALRLSQGEGHDKAIASAIHGETDISERIENYRRSLN